MTKTRLKGIGMLVGMIFGAGVFALPFAVLKAGIFWGSLHFILALLIMIFLHLWYGEIAYCVPGNNRFTGYAAMFLGNKAKWFAFLITVLTYYGALLVYGLLGGIFLANFFPLSPITLSLSVFVIGGILVFLHFEKLAGINFFLTVLLLGFVVLLLIIAFSYIKISNFDFANFNFSFSGDWFLPYGIWLFSLAGFAVLPEMRDMFIGATIKNFKRSILAGILICAVFYLIFIFTIIGVSGKMTTSDSLTGLAKVLGTPALVAGSLLGFLVVFTSFIALGADLKNIFRYDFHFPPWLVWLSVVVPPIFLFLTGAENFTRILGITGSIGLGLMGILIILMTRKLRRERGDYERFSKIKLIAGGLLMAGIIAAVISEF